MAHPGSPAGPSITAVFAPDSGPSEELRLLLEFFRRVDRMHKTVENNPCGEFGVGHHSDGNIGSLSEQIMTLDR